jgi:hypothetical protein
MLSPYRFKHWRGLQCYGLIINLYMNMFLQTNDKQYFSIDTLQIWLNSSTVIIKPEIVLVAQILTRLHGDKGM